MRLEGKLPVCHWPSSKITRDTLRVEEVKLVTYHTRMDVLNHEVLMNLLESLNVG